MPALFQLLGILYHIQKFGGEIFYLKGAQELAHNYSLGYDLVYFRKLLFVSDDAEHKVSVVAYILQINKYIGIVQYIVPREK